MDRFGIFIFLLKYQLLILSPNGGKLPSPTRQTADTRGEVRIRELDGKTGCHLCCRWSKEEDPGTATFQGGCSLLQGYLQWAQVQKRRGGKSESLSLSKSQLSCPGLRDVCPQKQSYSNSGMSFA